MGVKYIGKCVLIEDNRERILVVGDIHLGYGERGDSVGEIIDNVLERKMMKEFEEIFSNIGEVDKIVLLGDLKQGFSGLERGERYGLVNLFDFLERKAKEIIVIKGNHDNYLLNILKNRTEIKDYYLWKEYAFLHGDRDFSEIYDKKIKSWVMGHLHPAISFREGGKIERYKCFLEGKYRSKKIIILPSFIEAGEGADVSEIVDSGNLAWNFEIRKFKVLVVGENGQVLEFGLLGKLRING